jgi:hypothetical protein
VVSIAEPSIVGKLNIEKLKKEVQKVQIVQKVQKLQFTENIPEILK